ncbi:hypothetical protein ACWCYY_26320 [Kitasatospora sp. NPDC001664]
MSTDIYGGIEFRHPGVDAGYYEGEPWVKAMDLWPLYDQNDHESFSCLFGVHDRAGFRPPSAGRGLPADVSSGLADLGPQLEAGDLHGATWVDWAEIAGIDPRATPAVFSGRLSWSAASHPARIDQRLVSERWPADAVEAVGPPPPGLDRARPAEWSRGGLRCRYEPLTAGSLLGDGSGWEHVFAVMKALADRYGERHVRLVVAFD